MTLVVLAARRWLTWTGAAGGVLAMLVLMYWADSDISDSSSTTAGLGFLVVPPLLYLLGAATFVVDRAAVLAWRFARGSSDASS